METRYLVIMAGDDGYLRAQRDGTMKTKQGSEDAVLCMKWFNTLFKPRYSA